MRLDTPTPLVYLEHGEVLTLDDAEGVRIGARTGTVWVTQEGRFRDDIVSPGDAIVVGNPGRTIVQALRPAWITVDPAAARRQRPAMNRRPEDIMHFEAAWHAQGLRWIAGLLESAAYAARTHGARGDGRVQPTRTAWRRCAYARTCAASSSIASP